jgi:hypothetical protein
MKTYGDVILALLGDELSASLSGRLTFGVTIVDKVVFSPEQF